MEKEKERKNIVEQEQNEKEKKLYQEGSILLTK
jgi:hypothetical protein